MRISRWLLALAATAAAACGPTDQTEPAVGQTEQELVSTAQAKLADLEVQGLVLLDATKKSIPGILTSPIPPVIAALITSWGVRPDPECTSTHLYPDGDGDGVPTSLLVHFDCYAGTFGAYTHLVGGIMLKDTDDTVMGPGYEIAFDRLSLTKRVALVGNETRSLTGRVKVVESLEEKGRLELSNVLSWKFTTEGTAGISELRYLTHTTGVYIPEEATPLAPPDGGFLRLDGDGKLTLPTGAVLQFRYGTEEQLHHSLVCERKFPQGTGFDSGIVSYGGGGAPLSLEFRRCNTWIASREGES